MPELEPEAVVVIEHQARARMDGVYVNCLHLDASAVDRSGYIAANAALRVEVQSTEVAPRMVR